VMCKVTALGEIEELEDPKAHERRYKTWKNICIGINLDEASVPGWKLSYWLNDSAHTGKTK
jgi:hypothetical protein